MTILPKYTKKLISICAEKSFSMLPLGEVGPWPIWLIRTQIKETSKKKRVLVVAGFHGEEKAGPWAILKWLESFTGYPGMDISIIPVVNPTAFNKYVRYNTWNQKSNCGFCHDQEEPSEEGKILLKHINRLHSLSMDGFLSLHEDIELRKEYYLYIFEPTSDPGQFTCGLLEELALWWEKPLNGASAADSGLKTPPFAVNGLVYKYCDGSFEDYLFHKGVNRVAVTETPGKAKLEKRIDCNVAIINKFLDLIKRSV